VNDVARKASEYQQHMELLLKANNIQKSYSEWRAEKLRQVALDMVAGSGGAYADAVIQVAEKEMTEVALKKLLKPDISASNRLNQNNQTPTH
jgi:hypothetical protein